MKPKLVKITQFNITQANGTLTPAYLVQFTVGENGPFTEQVPGDQFNSKNVLAIMAAKAKEIETIAAGA